MWSLVRDLLQNASKERTIVLMDMDEVGAARRYRIRPSHMMGAWAGSLLVIVAIVAGLLVFSPLRTLIPGYGTKKIQESAQLNAMRLQALQDSLVAQRRYVRQLRRLITGRADSTRGMPRLAESRLSEGKERAGGPVDSRQDDGGAHEQPALSPFAGAGAGGEASDRSGPPANFAVPLSPPVRSGFPTRDFDATTGHYGIDVAVSEGEYIRAVADGYVVWADWTQDGGYTIAVQHTNGYLSVYKHNKRLLKQLGDRVRAQEPVAVSGNTGVMTTGPHLHFELWRNGLAQGPRAYVAGW